MQGIYKIENIKNNKKYIGSSKNIEKRFRGHKKNLETGKHHSIKLQRAWNKTKNKNIFSFEVIEEVKDIKNLKKREQYYIDLYDAYYNGYNCSLKVDNPSYTKRNVDKMDRKDDIPRLQKEFVSLYDAKRIDLRGWSYSRFTKGDYKYITYKIILTCIKWFLNMYPERGYNVQIAKREYDDISSICLYLSYKQQEFAKYNYIKGQITLDKICTKKIADYYSSKGVYDPVHHQLRGVVD